MAGDNSEILIVTLRRARAHQQGSKWVTQKGGKKKKKKGRESRSKSQGKLLFLGRANKEVGKGNGLKMDVKKEPEGFPPRRR